MKLKEAVAILAQNTRFTPKDNKDNMTVERVLNLRIAKAVAEKYVYGTPIPNELRQKDRSDTIKCLHCGRKHSLRSFKRPTEPDGSEYKYGLEKRCGCGQLILVTS
jgi:hypothetical protein